MFIVEELVTQKSTLETIRQICGDLEIFESMTQLRFGNRGQRFKLVRKLVGGQQIVARGFPNVAQSGYHRRKSSNRDEYKRS